MEPNKDQQTPGKPEQTKKPPDSFFQPYGGLDPVLVELSDVLPAKVFENVPLG